MEKILIVDNADSFVYNLVELVRAEKRITIDIVSVYDVSMDNVYNADAVLLSPGAGLPSDYPQMHNIIDKIKYTHPILGVCLGHQAIASYFGASLKQLDKPKHGHTSYLQNIDSKDKLLRGLQNGSAVARYHSWVVNPANLPIELSVTSYDEDGNIMSIRHNELPIYGLQFHPESIISEKGVQIIKNFLA